MNGQTFFFSILRSLFGKTEQSLSTPSFEEFAFAYRLAEHHGLEHVLYYEAKRRGCLPVCETAEQTARLAKADRRLIQLQYWHVKMELELERCCQLLVDEQIAFIPMKGALLCALYPEPWMRPRVDLDILIHEDDVGRAVKALTAIGYTTDGERHYHNVSLFCQNVHLELHYSIMERHEKMDVLLEQVWDHTVADGYRYTQTPAFFRFHHVAHMAHHLLGGGCGIRSFVDMWLLRHASDHDEAAVRALCEQTDLAVFYGSVCRLCDVWFGDVQHDEHTRRLEEFVLQGGTFGTKQQRETAVRAAYDKRNITKRLLCMPYADLKNLYPTLVGRPYLTLFYRIWHIVRRVKQGRGIAAISRIHHAHAQEDPVNTVKDLFASIGLI